MFSATLHSPEITATADKICKFPTWVDLKGKESVPEVGYLSLLHSFIFCLILSCKLMSDQQSRLCIMQSYGPILKKMTLGFAQLSVPKRMVFMHGVRVYPKSSSFTETFLSDRAPTSKTLSEDVQYSQAIKLLKVTQHYGNWPACSCAFLQPLLVAKLIDAHKMDQALIFVRTRVDADNLQSFLNDLGGAEKGKKCTLHWKGVLVT